MAERLSDIMNLRRLMQYISKVVVYLFSPYTRCFKKAEIKPRLGKVVVYFSGNIFLCEMIISPALPDKSRGKIKVSCFLLLKSQSLDHWFRILEM